MIGFRLRDNAVPMTVPSSPGLGGVDLSQYRGFQFGMSLLAVTKQIRMETSEAKVVHQRPAAILELTWQPQRYRHGDSVKDIVFTFYDGELFRIGVTYDQSRTDGLTVDDVIEAISAAYGEPTSPVEEMMFPSIYHESVKVLARWEDAKYSFNLVIGNYLPAFRMVMFSKRLSAMAETAAAEAVRLDTQEAPQVEADRVEKEGAEHRAQQEKARKVNKESFRP